MPKPKDMTDTHLVGYKENPDGQRIPVIRPMQIIRTEHADGSIDTTIIVPKLQIKRRGHTADKE